MRNLKSYEEKMWKNPLELAIFFHIIYRLSTNHVLTSFPEEVWYFYANNYQKIFYKKKKRLMYIHFIVINMV